ncbi:MULTISPECIES: cytochrome d ubiquinol oxidase subunit II [Pseudoalteromonas]|uniref:Cytochrome bd-type quinol oxidase, subunit 2 n=1 Tax=Pseudoalteromonas luteoviolacea (strain 2ta16) TaxID=1353533 RepID=V4JEJ7_PSEL2|nr:MULTISPECIES: cytochrome d ubiquinol oxidase subunit II [Pseudoalteromonas]ESP93452.1 cytochrome bd-type quinol oxidase, subunit 2 [Pseudoalteromonas luteoviolacea 2ta16]KZN43926.1 cytochrome BD ubiquinol oxidase subunit II [Pseudoalteromonas luteoviolacea NCIMB 1944]MCG7549136.1 cytochrome d ubiquinol oxidase subunit II [Pseudoalteromonas sp. Of7M-16]
MLSTEFLAQFYGALMALAILVYAILDGYDLGVGILLPPDNKEQADTMIASIGPFWDANETWLVLAVGLALIAFPLAHSVILQALYLPVALMLLGLILRGVAFDFRAKAKTKYQDAWDISFKLGSVITAFSQGFMLGLYVMSFDSSLESYAFAILSGIGVVSAYGLIGSAWLVMKTTDSLQAKAVAWCRKFNLVALLGVVAVSIINPLINDFVADKWFGDELSTLLLPVPFACIALFIYQDRLLANYKMQQSIGSSWKPFAITTLIFLLCFFGLLYSFYPYVVPNQLTIYESLADASALTFMMYGVVLVVPAIIGYTIFSYRVFWGKTEALSYY